MAAQIGVIDHSSCFMAASRTKAPFSQTSIPIFTEDSSAEVTSVESDSPSPVSSKGHKKNASSSSSVPPAESPVRRTIFTTTSPNRAPAKPPHASVSPLEYNSRPDYSHSPKSSSPITGHKQLSLYREQATSPFQPPTTANFGSMRHNSFSEPYTHTFPGQQTQQSQELHSKPSHPPSAFSNRPSPLFPRNSDPGEFPNYPRQPSPPKRRATFSRPHVPRDLNLEIQSEASANRRNHRRRSSYAYQASPNSINDQSMDSMISHHGYTSPSDLASPNTIMTHHQLHDMISRGLPFSFLPMSTHQVLALCEDHAVLESQLAEYSLLVDKNDKLMVQLETERERVETVQSQLIQMNELNLAEKKKYQDKMEQLESELAQQAPRIKDLENQLAEAEKRLKQHESVLQLEFERWKQKAELERAETERTTSEAHASALQSLQDAHREEKQALDTAYLTKIDSLMNAHSIERAKLIEALEAREKQVERARSGSMEDVTKTRRNLAKRHEEEMQSLKRAHADKLSAMEEFHKQEKEALQAKLEREQIAFEAERKGFEKERGVLTERLKEQGEGFESRTAVMRNEFESEKKMLRQQFALEKKRMEKEAAEAKRRLEEQYRASNMKIEASFEKIREDMETVLDQATEEWESDKQKWELEKEQLVEKARRARGEFDEQRERMERMIKDLKIDKDCLVKENSRLNKVLKRLGNAEEGNENWCKGDTYYEGAFGALMNAIVEISKEFSILPTTEPVPRYALDYLPAGLTWELIRSPNPSSQYLRQSFVQHTISRLLCEKIFNPFIFTLTKSSNRISTYLQTLSEDLRKKSTRREAVWRMYTMSAVFPTASSKKQASIIATSVQEEIIDLLSPFLEGRKLDAFKVSLGKIVKRAVETWRYARMEKEVFSARMEQLPGDGPDSWLEHPYTSLKGLHPTLSPLSQGFSSAHGTMFLPLLPLISREGTVPSAATPDAPLDDGYVFTPGTCLYTTSAPLVLRKQELLTEPKVITPRSSYKSMIPLPVSKGGRVSPMPGEDRERERARRREERRREREIEERLEREERERMEFEMARAKVAEEMMSRSGIVGVEEFRVGGEENDSEQQKQEFTNVNDDTQTTADRSNNRESTDGTSGTAEQDTKGNAEIAGDALMTVEHEDPYDNKTTEPGSHPKAVQVDFEPTYNADGVHFYHSCFKETPFTGSDRCSVLGPHEEVTAKDAEVGESSKDLKLGFDAIYDAEGSTESLQSEEDKLDTELEVVNLEGVAIETTENGIGGANHADMAMTDQVPAWIGFWQNDRGIWACAESMAQVGTGYWRGMSALAGLELHWQTGDGWWESENATAWQNGDGCWRKLGVFVSAADKAATISALNRDRAATQSDACQMKFSEDRAENEKHNDSPPCQDSGRAWHSSGSPLQAEWRERISKTQNQCGRYHWQNEMGYWELDSSVWQMVDGQWRTGMPSEEAQAAAVDKAVEVASEEQAEEHFKSEGGCWQADEGHWEGCGYYSQTSVGQWCVCEAESTAQTLRQQSSFDVQSAVTNTQASSWQNSEGHWISGLSHWQSAEGQWSTEKFQALV